MIRFFSIFSPSAKGNVFASGRLLLPLVLAMAANAVNQFADRAFLARYSDVAIQGSLPGGILSWLFVCLLVSTAGYSGTFVAHYWGAGSRRAAAGAFAQGVWLAVASVPVLALSIPLGHVIFDWCAHAPEVRAAEKIYYDILQLGGVFCVLGTVLAGYFTGLGRTRIVGVATIAGNALNVLLDWMFIFGHGGCGRWGIAGAGWATAIAAAVPCVILFAVLVRDPLWRSVRRVRALLRPKPALLWRIVRYGIPSGAQMFLDVLTFTVFVMLTGRLDAMSFAVSNVGFAINHLSFAPLMGISQGAQVLVGQFQGEGDSRAAARAAMSCLMLGLVYAAVFTTFILVGSDFCMDFFHGAASQFPQDEFRALGRTLMLLLACWAALDAVTLILEGALKGAGDTRFVLNVQLGVSVGVWMPLVLAVMYFHPAIAWMWGTMPVYCALCAICSAVRFARGRWRAHDLVHAAA